MKAVRFWPIILSFVCLFPFPGAAADPIGEVHIAGNTWCELQWDRSIEKMIALDTVDNSIYVVWTYAPPPPYSYHRRSYFNNFNPETGWTYEEPGYEMFPGVSNQEYHSILLLDCFGGREKLEIGINSIDPSMWNMRAWWQNDHFESMPLDSIWYPEERLVRKAYGRDGYIHMVAEGIHEWPIDIRELYYGRYRLNPFEFGGWEFVDTLTNVDYGISKSPVSDRTAIVYLKQKSFGGPEYYYSLDSDFYLLDSDDGMQWDWQDRLDITHFAESDVFRPPLDSDVDIVIDYSNQIHVAFSASETHIDQSFPESTDVNLYMTYIWHWSEATDSFSVVADGWIQNPPPSWECYFGANMLPVGKPQMGIDPYSGNLYILYERNDCEDCSHGPKHPNTDLWVTVSTDNGLNWSIGTNITDTQTPDCALCECSSEIQASINDIVNDSLHVVYILDKDAGIYQYDNGFLCESKVVYQKIPIDLIPSEPLIPQFSIRTGPPTYVEDGSVKPVPKAIEISQIYPNPFNTSTIIKYTVNNTGQIDLSIYDLLGRKVETLVNRETQAGNHQAIWDASDFSSGVYFAVASSGDRSAFQKMVLIK